MTWGDTPDKLVLHCQCLQAERSAAEARTRGAWEGATWLINLLCRFLIAVPAVKEGRKVGEQGFDAKTAKKQKD